MSTITLEAKTIAGGFLPPPDKSISHRAVIISALASGTTRIENLSICQDCQHSLEAIRALGVRITESAGGFQVQGNGLAGLSQPKKEIYLANSGTSMRLILGVLAGQQFSCTLSGDASLSQRPMKRVTQPLSLMGARITGKKEAEFAPLTIQGGELRPISYEMPVASAQVKSAILLAGLYAQGTTAVHEPAKSRDHTERMLKKFGADIFTTGLSVSVKGRVGLIADDIIVPGDISAASFFLVGACLADGSEVLVKSVGLNPTRRAYLAILQKMGAALNWKYQDSRMASEDYQGEAKGEIAAKYSSLKGLTISPEQVPALIDELPILMVAATQAEGETLIEGAGELRVKETDRISAMVTNLSQMGANIESHGNGIVIRGPVRLSGTSVDSFGDHRIAMSMAIAALVASGRTTIINSDCVDISFPGFFETLSRLTH